MGYFIIAGVVNIIFYIYLFFHPHIYDCSFKKIKENFNSVNIRDQFIFFLIILGFSLLYPLTIIFLCGIYIGYFDKLSLKIELIPIIENNIFTIYEYLENNQTNIDFINIHEIKSFTQRFNDKVDFTFKFKYKICKFKLIVRKNGKINLIQWTH